MERSLSPSDRAPSVWAGRRRLEAALGAAQDDGARSILAVAGAGLMAALAGLLLSGAAGVWTTGLGLAAAVLLAAGLGILLLLYRQSRAAAPAELRQALQRTCEALAMPAVLTDRRGRPMARNRCYRTAFGARAPENLLEQGLGEAERADLFATLQRCGHARAGLTAAGRELQLAVVEEGDCRLWSFAPPEEESRTDRGDDARLPRAPDTAAPLEAVGEALAGFSVGLGLADAGGRLVFVSKTLAAWLGVGRAEDVPELSARMLLDPDRGEFHPGGGIALIKQVFDGGDAGRIVLVRPPSTAGQPGQHAAADTALLEALFAAAPIGLAVVDQTGRLREFNAAFKSFAPNRNPHEGETLDSYVASEDRAKMADRLEAVFAGETVAKPLEVAFNTQPPRTGQVFVAPLPGREPPAALVHLIDTTQHKSLERQFVQAQKMQAVGQLAGGVAHDFNNLLTAIIGFCDLLLVRHGPGDQSFSDIMQIKQNANRASNLVRQLLAFSRQQTMRPKVLSVTDVLADLSNLLRRLIGETIELEMIHGRDLGAVRVDQGQLEQVIINLAVNARDAMPEGGTLTIRTRAVGADDDQIRQYSVMPRAAYVLIEVGDTGQGIPPEHHNKIFEPFFTTKSVGKGTGLGLSTVYGIIKQTGGFIFVESASGEGATFRIYLPVHEREASDTVVTGESPPKDLTGKGTVLICEDEDAVRMFAARALENKGYAVLQASSGEEAMEMLEDGSRRVDLLVSDVVMPNMDGPALVEAARKIRPEMRIVFISGYAEDVFRKTLGQAKGEFAFLPKPFSLKQLAETVKDSLER